MTNFPSLKNPLTLEEIKNIRNGFEITFSKELGDPEWSSYTTFSFPDFGLSWTNKTEHDFAKQEFINYSFAITGEREPKEIDKKLLDIEQDLAKNPGQVYRVTPTEEAIERGERLAEEQKVQATKAEAVAKAQTEKFLKQQQKKATTAKKVVSPPAPQVSVPSEKKVEEFVGIQKTVVEEAKKAKETLKDKKIYVKVAGPEPAKLTADEQKALNNLRSMAQETPHILVENITKTIEKKLPGILKKGASPEEIHYYAEAVAVKAVDNLRAGPQPPDKDTVVLASLSNHPEVLDKLNVSEPEKKFVLKASSDLATLKMLPYRASQETLNAVFGKNVTEQILGPDPTTIGVIFTDLPQESTDTVPLDRLAENYQTTAESPFFSQVQSFGVDKIKGKLIDFGKEKVLGQIGKLPADSFLGKITASERFGGILNLLKPGQTIEATNLFGKLVMNFSPEFAPIVSGIGKLIGVDFGLISVPATAVITPIIIPEAIAIQGAVTTTAPPVVTAVAGGAAKKGIGVAIGTKILTGAASLAAKAGLTGLSTQIGALIGTPFGGFIGAAIGAFIGWVAGKVLEPILNWAKKHQEDLKILGLVMLGGGAVLRSIPMFVFGGLIFIPTALKTGFSMARIAARTAFIFGRIGASLAITIGTPIIVAIIVFPILVAIILFIINSGAYIVPPLSNLATSCDSTEKPTAEDTIFSQDGKYVFPLANAQKTSLSCTHWDHKLATDIFTQHLQGDQFPVLAYTSGVIEGISLNDSLGGKYIILKGNDGRYYYYAHNCALFVNQGDSVSAGDVIAVTDNTGSAANTPEHLHFAISKFPFFYNGGTVCPSKEFEDKFHLGRCTPANECIP